MAYDTDIQHPQKEAGYPHIFGRLAKMKTVFLMPSAECRDVRWLLGNGVIDTNTTLFAVENDPHNHAKMIMKLKSLGFSRENGNLKDFLCNLHEVPDFGLTLDLCFIDLCGTITMDIARWMATTLSKALTSSSRLCFTASSIPRNNVWIDEMWRIMNLPCVIDNRKTSAANEFQACYPSIGMNEAKPIIWLYTIFHQFMFKLSAVRTYNDTVPMFSVYLENFDDSQPADYSQESLEKDFDPDRIEEFYARERAVSSNDLSDETVDKTPPLSVAECKAKIKAFLAEHDRFLVEISNRNVWVLDNQSKSVVYADAKSVYEILEYFQIT